MQLSKSQLSSWWDRLTFVKNEVQAEIDTTLPGTDARLDALERLNASLADAKEKIIRLSDDAGIALFGECHSNTNRT